MSGLWRRVVQSRLAVEGVVVLFLFHAAQYSNRAVSRTRKPEAPNFFFHFLPGWGCPCRLKIGTGGSDCGRPTEYEVELYI